MKRVVLFCLLGIGLPTAVCAQTPDAPKVTPDSENGRYSMSAVPDGLMRLDTRTGQMSLCRKRTEVWTCESVADDRVAYDTEISRLQEKNAKLEAELGRGANKGTELKLPTEAELDRVMKFFENVFRRFIGMIEGLQRENQQKGT